MKLSDYMKAQKSNTQQPISQPVTTTQQPSTGGTKLSTLMQANGIKPLGTPITQKSTTIPSTSQIAEPNFYEKLLLLQNGAKVNDGNNEPNAWDRIYGTINGGSARATGQFLNAINVGAQALGLNTNSNLEKWSNKAMDDSSESITYAKKGLGKTGQTLVDVGSYVPEIIGDVAVGLVTGGTVPLASMGVRSFGGGAYEAEQNGAALGEQAAYGGLQAATSVLTAKLSSVGKVLSKTYGKGLLDNAFKSATDKVINKLFKGEFGNAIAQRIATMVEAGAGEGLEEAIQSALTPAFQKITYDTDANWSDKYNEQTVESVLYDGMIGAILGFGMGSGGATTQATANSTLTDAAQASAIAPTHQASTYTTAAQNTGTTQHENNNPLLSMLKAKQTETQLAINQKRKKLLSTLVGNMGASATEQSAAVNATDSTLPQGTGAASPQFAYQEAVNQQNSTDSAFTNTERLIEGLRAEDSTHRVVTDAEVVTKAQERLEFDYDGEKADLPSKQYWDKADTTAAHLILRDLTEKARRSGDYSEVIKWNKMLESHKSAQGQALQANKQFANTPESIVAEAAEMINSDSIRKLSPQKRAQLLDEVYIQANKYNKVSSGDINSLISLIKENSKIRKTTGLFSNQVSRQMDWALETYSSNFDGAESILRDVAIAQIRNIAGDYKKLSILDGIKSYRIMGMLSKVNTILRNLTSNNVFDPLESLSNNISVPLDILLSKYTKTRSTTIDKSWASEAKRQGSLEGALKSFIQVGLDADVTYSQSKYETRSGRSFKMTGSPIERFLSTWSKWENYALQTTDEFQKGGIAAETQRGINDLKSRGLIAEDALADRAIEVAKQRTFQNDGMLATTMIKGRDALNTFAIKDKQGGSFGAGDLAIPFAKIPANITAQLGNYSPIGLTKGAYNIAKTFKQAHDGTLTADQQAKAVTDIGRGLIGTSGIAMFTAFALKGIIRVAGSDDKDMESLETAEGQRGTQFNISALERWLNGEDTEWRDNDKLMSIGFLEPINGLMAAGAVLADDYRENGSIGLGDVANATTTAVFQAVIDLPAMSQISDLVNGYKYSKADTTSGKLADSATSYGASQAASFAVPNIIGGVATGMDDTVRDTYTSNNPLIQARDNIVSKIPFARNTLPAKLDNYGNERKYTGNPLLDALNANILPGQLGSYKTNEVNQELYRLDEATDEVSYPNRKAPNSIKYESNTYELSAEDRDKYLKTAGQLTYDLMQKMIDKTAYDKMTDEQKAETMSQIMSYANDMAKREYVGSSYESNDFEKVYQAYKAGVNPADYFVYQTKLKEIDDNGSYTQLETAQALEQTDLTTKYKGELWQLQNSESKPDKNPYTGTLAQQGLKPEKNIEIMAAYAEIEKALESYVKPEGGASSDAIASSYLKQWLTKQGYNSAQSSAIMDVYKYWYNIPAKPTRKSEAYVATYPMP